LHPIDKFESTSEAAKTAAAATPASQATNLMPPGAARNPAADAISTRLVCSLATVPSQGGTAFPSASDQTHEKILNFAYGLVNSVVFNVTGFLPVLPFRFSRMQLTHW